MNAYHTLPTIQGPCAYQLKVHNDLQIILYRNQDTKLSWLIDRVLSYTTFTRNYTTSTNLHFL